MAGARNALIVANDEYEQEGLRNLLAPAADAEALGQVLADPKIGNFAVQVVHNEPAHVIQARIEDLLSESRPDDVLLLHFSGHGLKSDSGELFFAAANTRPDRLRATAVPADFVQRCMRDSRSRSIVLLLDCCYGGAFAQGVTVRAAGDVNVLDSFPREGLGGGRGRAVITASSAMEYAFEGDHLADDQHGQPSVFTAAVVEGLATGDADRDEDGWVSLGELYDYVFDKVRARNPRQTPTRQVDLQGELRLARSARRRIRPAPVPPDLQDALTDPNMYTRLGAVSELRARLASSNLPAAAGAYEALAEQARTAIRYVADPAEAALREAAVKPSQTELHFGQVEQGSPSPHRTVHLLGPLIARACVPRPSHDWIRVNETAEGLDISIDTNRTGTLSGSLNLQGPTGEAAITIDVDLVATPPLAHRFSRRDKLVGYRVVPPATPISPAGGPHGTPLPLQPSEDAHAQPTGPSQQTTDAPCDTSDRIKPASDPDDAATLSVRRRSGTFSTGIRHVLWTLIPLLSYGTLAPLPFAYAARRLRDRTLWIIAIAYTIAEVAVIVALAVSNTIYENSARAPVRSPDGPAKVAFDIAMGVAVAGMVVATVHAAQLVRRVFPQSPASPPQPGQSSATQSAQVTQLP